MISVYIVTPNRVLTAQIRRLLAHEPALQVFESSRGNFNAREMADGGQSTCVIVGLGVPAEGDLAFIRTLKAQHPQIALVALSALDTEDYRRAAIAAGADRYVHSHELGTSLVPTLIDSLHDLKVV